MSDFSAFLPTAEQALLAGQWQSSSNATLADDPVLSIAREVVEGDFAKVLTNPLVRPVLTIKDKTVIKEDGSLQRKIELDYGSPPDLSEDVSELLRLLVGVACIHAFIQVNWTGPDVATDPSTLLKTHNPNIQEIKESDLHSQAIAQLSSGGEPAYHLAKYPSFLRFALDIFNLPYKHCASAPWWLFRAVNIQQQILDEPAGLDQAFFHSTDDLQSKLGLADLPDLDGRRNLERGLLQHIFGHDKSAAEDFVKAAKTTQLQYELTGALGKRTKFQITDHSQLVVLAESRAREEDPPSEGTNKSGAPGTPTPSHPTLPETLPLNDDTLLEQTQFTSTTSEPGSKQPVLSHLNPANQPALHPLDQCILLALCLNVKNTSPSHGLTKEQMTPYVTRVISHPRNWSIHTMALLLRSRLEADRTRTVERSTLQLQALIDQMPTSDSTIKERLQYFHAILLPSKWEMEKELATRFLSIGVVRSALEIFERLEMWEHVVACWKALERPEKGIAIVKDLLQGSRAEADLVVARAKAGDSQKVAMDAARTAKLWCLLGELEPENAVEHFEQAWELSGRKSGRAMRSLGGYHFARGDFASAVPCLQRSAAINPLQHRTWFVLGCALVRLEKWEEARDAFARCVSIDDEDGESWSNLASVYLRMGFAESKKADNGEAEDDKTLVEDSEFIPRAVPFANKMLAFRALKQGLRHSYDNWRMWSNYMVVAVDVGELSEACRAAGRVVEERSAKDGDKCVDYDVLDRLVDAVTRADDDGDAQAQFSPNSGKRLAPRVSDLFTRIILPRFSSSPRIFRSYARLLMWQTLWSAALEAYINAYRASVVSDETVTTDLKRFREAVVELEELVDVMRNLGPRASEEEAASNEADRPAKRATSWQFQARGLVRTFMGRTKDNFGEEAEWERLESLLKELRT